MTACSAALLFGALLASGALAAGAAVAGEEAVSATVTGAAIQQVGFRAMIQKEAIMFNLAGSARNNADGSVSVTLQGDRDGIDQTIAAMRTGNKKSSTDNAVAVAPAPVDPALKTFTVFDWTSTSRQIDTKYDLVFPLRPDGGRLSHGDAKAVWNGLAEKVLNADDRAKFMNHLDADD